MPRFFVSGPLGFEQKLIEELQSVWFLLADLDGLPTRAGFPEMTVIEGGVEFDTELHLGLQLNFFSKQAYRVLLRVAHFPARFYDQLEKQLAQINWAGYLKPESSVGFKVSFAKSRLNNEKNLIEACQNVFKKKGFNFSEEPEQTLFIRITRDHAEISIDSSGEHLHRRGYRLQQGEAPIRENLAALLWSFMPEMAGPNDLIFDPFCGSGTLLFEYLLKAQPNFSRPYAFLSWPNCPAIMKSATFNKNFRWIDTSDVAPQLLGSDMSADVLKKAQANWELVQKHYGLKSRLHWLESRCAQVKLDGAIVQQPGGTLFVVANPPYGERLDDRGAMEDLNIFLKQNGSGFQQVHVLVLQPLGRVPEFENVSLKDKIPFSNQGLKLNLLHYLKKRNIKIESHMDKKIEIGS